MLSIGHRLSLRKYHLFNLKFQKKGEWKQEKIEKTQEKEKKIEWKTIEEHKPVEIVEQEKTEEDPSLLEEDVFSEERSKNITANWSLIKRTNDLFRIGKGSDTVLINSQFKQICYINMLQTILTLIMLILLSSLNSTIVSHDTSKYFKLLSITAAIFVVIGLCAVGSVIISQRMGVNMRRNMASYFQNRYFQNNLFYKVNNIDRRIDNIDRRMTTAIDDWCTGFTESGFGSLTIFFFRNFWAILLYTIGASKQNTWLNPLMVFAYFLVFSVVSKFLMNKVSRYKYTVDKREGDFRFSHLNIREWVESIAMNGGIQRERYHSNKIFNSLLESNWSLIFRQFFLNLVVDLGNNSSR